MPPIGKTADYTAVEHPHRAAAEQYVRIDPPMELPGPRRNTAGLATLFPGLMGGTQCSRYGSRITQRFASQDGQQRGAMLWLALVVAAGRCWREQEAHRHSSIGGLRGRTLEVVGESFGTHSQRYPSLQRGSLVIGDLESMICKEPPCQSPIFLQMINGLQIGRGRLH